ncbi:hypothetical protein F5Y16DRAFT_406564 [Xylariaceae sp. FL0255]|nr:hypothetical protein F5Y16DRAFT_406564 [Xylariaceae sp. FL0255]
MYFSTAIVSTIAMLSVGTMAASIKVPVNARAILIATDPEAACNCPNNCDHELDSSCKFYETDSSIVQTGTCQQTLGGLYCTVS